MEDYTEHLKKDLIYFKNEYEKSLKEYGEEHPDTISHLACIATTHSKLQEYETALNIYDKVYSLICKISGEGHHITLSTLNTIAELHEKLGNIQKAIDLREKEYAIQCKTTGTHSYDSLQALNKLIDIYQLSGDNEKANELIDKYSHIMYYLRLTRDSLRNSQQPDFADPQKALEYYDSEYKKEKANYEACLDTFDEVNDYIISAMFSLCCFYGTWAKSRKPLAKIFPQHIDVEKDLYEAVDFLKKAHSVFCKNVGEDAAGTIDILNHLARVYFLLGEHNKEIETQEKAYKLFCKNKSLYTFEIAIALYNLSYSYRHINNITKALEYKEKLYEYLCNTFGEEHPSAIKTLDFIARDYTDCHNYSKAAGLYEKEYLHSCKARGEKHQETIWCLFNMANMYERMENYEKTAETIEKFYILQTNDMNVLFSHSKNLLNKLEKAYKMLDTSADNLEIKEKVHEFQWKALGERNSLTLERLQELADEYEKAGNYEKAAKYTERLYNNYLTLSDENDDYLIQLKKKLEKLKTHLENNAD